MESAPALDDCLKLLRGERDEQRLAGLLLATKFCKGDDNASILRVYNAVGPRFLDRLLMTGMGKGTQSVKGGEDRESYLRLSVTVLAALCRVPEIASSEDMVSKVPIVLEIISKSSDKSIFEECFEFLFLVATTSIDGLTRLYEAGVISVLASHTSTIPNDIYEGSRAMELAMKLLQLIFNRLPLEVIYMKYHSEISCLVVTIARQFAMMQNALKFDALHLLTTILSSAYAVALYDLRSMSSESWAAYIRIGMVAILQNRVASFDKLQALILAESMMSILGENWLLDHRNMPGNQNPMSADKCLLLVLESARIEVAVLLNELAYLKYETSKNPSADAETIVLKQRNLAISFSVIEKIIKLISNVCGVEGCPITDDTTTKVISGLNETTGLVLDYLQDAKDHGQRKGDDLLASVRIVGSYLAETPFACKEKVQDLMEYILSVEGEDEMSPFYSVCFMLPMLCQTTMDIDGCKALASFGGHKAVVDYLVKLIGPSGATVGDNGTIFLACDTIMNLLLNREEISAQLEESHFIHLLHALAFWAEESNDETVIMMATSLSSLIFDITSEEALLKCAAFELHTLQSLSQLFARSLDANAQAKRRSDSVEEQMDLHHIVMAGYSRWADRFPLVKKAVERRA